jgi:hypothetical protein
LDGNGALNDVGDIIQVLKIMLANAPGQYHFVVITLVLENINSESRVGVKTVFVNCLTYLIRNGKLAGITIPELLENCTKHLRMITSSSSENDAKLLKKSLIKAIGTFRVKHRFTIS